MRTMGCWANATPAVAVAEGWVCTLSRLAAPAISRNRPKFEMPLVTPAMIDVPDLVILPNPKGVPASGRTRTFCQVSLQVGPELAMETVKVSCVELTDVIATEVPLVTP